jgi:large subunit ribosomal protein L17
MVRSCRSTSAWVLWCVILCVVVSSSVGFTFQCSSIISPRYVPQFTVPETTAFKPATLITHPRHTMRMISHGMGFNRLSRPADQRKALLRSLTTAALRHGRIRTTITKAKALRKPVDHMITLAKRGTLHARRQAYAYIYDKGVVQALFEKAPKRYQFRQGGYCRVIKEEKPRAGDGAQMAIFELVE